MKKTAAVIKKCYYSNTSNFIFILAKEEPSSAFQRYRVDALLKILTEKFPPPQQVKKVVPTPAASAGAGDEIKSEKGTESIKSEKVDSEARGIKREAQPTSNQSKKTKFN